MSAPKTRPFAEVLLAMKASTGGDVLSTTSSGQLHTELTLVRQVGAIKRQVSRSKATSSSASSPFEYFQARRNLTRLHGKDLPTVHIDANRPELTFLLDVSLVYVSN